MTTITTHTQAGGLEELLHTARNTSLKRDKGGAFTADLKTEMGNTVKAILWIEVVEWMGEKVARMETLVYDPLPDVLITDGGDHYEDDELWGLILDSDTTPIAALKKYDIPYDELCPSHVEYTEFQRERRLDQQPIWIKPNHIDTLKARLAK